MKKITSEQDENSNLTKQIGYSVWLDFAICEINLSISLTATSKWQWPNTLFHDCTMSHIVSNVEGKITLFRCDKTLECDLKLEKKQA